MYKIMHNTMIAIIHASLCWVYDIKRAEKCCRLIAVESNELLVNFTISSNHAFHTNQLNKGFNDSDNDHHYR